MLSNSLVNRLRSLERLIGPRGRDILLIYVPVVVVSVLVAILIFVWWPSRTTAPSGSSHDEGIVTNSPSSLRPSRPPGPDRLKPVSSTSEIAVASVNGEVITLRDLQTRAKVDKVLWALTTKEEPDFASESGRQTLLHIEEESLDNLSGERLIEQLAKGKTIVVDPTEVENEIVRLLAANNLAKDRFVEALSQNGVQYTNFSGIIEKVTRLNKFINDVVLEGLDEDTKPKAAQAWYEDISDQAQIRIYFSAETSQDETLLREAEAAATDYYKTRFGGKITAKAADLGSHVQVDVYEDGRFRYELVYEGNGAVKAVE